MKELPGLVAESAYWLVADLLDFGDWLRRAMQLLWGLYCLLVTAAVTMPAGYEFSLAVEVGCQERDDVSYFWRWLMLSVSFVAAYHLRAHVPVHGTDLAVITFGLFVARTPSLLFTTVRQAKKRAK